MNQWPAIAIAVISGGALWVRLASLLSTSAQRLRAAIGIAVGALIGLSQGLTKHQGTPWVTLLIADANVAFLVATIGAGAAIRAAASKEATTANASPIPKGMANRIVYIMLGVVIVLIGVEAVLLGHSS